MSLSDNIIKCEFCGFRFQKCDGKGCNSCFRNCNVVKCPNCGYEILSESKSYNFLESNIIKIKNKLFK